MFHQIHGNEERLRPTVPVFGMEFLPAASDVSGGSAEEGEGGEMRKEAPAPVELFAVPSREFRFSLELSVDEEAKLTEEEQRDYWWGAHNEVYGGERTRNFVGL